MADPAAGAQGPARIPALDGIRALAMAWMMGCHMLIYSALVTTPGQQLRLATSPLLRPLVHGVYGVDSLFVLSGFLIATLLFEERERAGGIRLRGFFVRRAFRVLPPYFLTLLLTWVLYGERANIHNAWANVLFVNNFLPPPEQAMPWSWSLAIEEQFYFLFPLLLAAFGGPLRRTLRPLLALLGLAFATRIALVLIHRIDFALPLHPALGDTEAFARYFANIFTSTAGRGGAILPGLIAAVLIRDPDMVRSYNARPWIGRAGVTAALLLAAYIVPRTFASPLTEDWTPLAHALFNGTFNLTFASITGYLVFHLLARRRLVDAPHATWTPSITSWLEWRIWKPFADLSYGAYLFNPIVILTLYSLDPPGGYTPAGMLLRFVLVFFVSYAIAWGVHRVYEDPLRRKGRELARGL